jgi:hypothetical protein
MLDLQRKRSTEWTYDDLSRLIKLQLEESSWLELKRDLSSDGSAKGWRDKRQVHPKERDGLAKEIVAFANSYGGTVIVGIAETDDHPKRAREFGKSLPDVHDLAESLQNSLFARIDPSIAGLSVSAIPDGKEKGFGFLAITVPASNAAPHGIGLPSQAYVRRENRSEPMSMRDLQNVFWESRMKIERIDKAIQLNKKRATEAGVPGHVGYSITAIPENEIYNYDIARSLKNGEIAQHATFREYNDYAAASEFPRNPYRWRPTDTGAEYEFEGGHENGKWTIDDNGTVTVFGALSGQVLQNLDLPVFFPHHLEKSLGYVIGLSSLLAEFSAYSGSWLMGVSFNSPATMLVGTSARDFGRSRQQFKGLASIRPVRILSKSDSEALSLLSQKTWACFHILMEDKKHLEKGIAEATQIFPDKNS